MIDSYIQEKHYSVESSKMSQLTQRVPVGFRFHPTDEELVGYYLPKKVTDRKIDLDLIRDLDLYKLEPWDLQGKRAQRFQLSFAAGVISCRLGIH